MQCTFQDIIILLPVRTICIKVTIHRQHTLALLAVLITIKITEQLHIQLTILWERYYIAV